MLTGVPIPGGTCFKLTNTSIQSGQHSQTEMCLQSCFDKVSVSWCIHDGNIILAGPEFPQGDINGDAMLTFSFQIIQDPGVFEEAFFYLSNLLLKFSLVLLWISPHLWIRWPIVVDLQESACPTMMMDESLFLFYFGLALVVFFMTPVFWWQSRCEKALLICSVTPGL